MKVRIVQDVAGNPVENQPPYDVPTAQGKVLIAAGLAVEVLPDADPYRSPDIGYANHTAEPNGNLIPKRPAPHLRWSIIPARRVNVDWTIGPALHVTCAACPVSVFVEASPNATEQEVRHCSSWSKVVNGIGSGTFKVLVEKCPQDVATQYLEQYSAWERKHKPQKPLGAYSTQKKEAADLLARRARGW